MRPGTLKSIPDGVLVFAFCALIVLQILLSLTDKSLTFDESNRFLAGYQYLAEGDFRLNPEHPPLVKYLVGLPLLFMKVTLPPGTRDWRLDNQWALGHDFLYKHNDAETIIWVGRLAVLPLTVLLAVFVFLWARDLFGRGGGLFALFLCTFEPNILAHGGLVNTDLGLACFVFLTVFGFYRLSDKITLGRVVFTALSFGLAMSTKFTALWLIPIMIILGLVRAFSQQGMVLRIPTRGERPVTSQRSKLGAVVAVWVVIGLAGYLTLWGAYQFRYWSVTPAGDPMFTAYFDGISPQKAPLKQAFSFARQHQLLPESYLFGVARVLKKKSRKAFLLGETGHGWWYYFFVTFFLKTPLPLIFLVALGLMGLRGRGPGSRAGPIFLFIPILVYFGIAVLSYLNIGHRHILVIYPFLFVLASAVVPWVERKGWLTKGLVGGLCMWYLISSLNVFPHYLAYFNELAGGPDKGHAYLLDSNLDWGQDLKGLKKFMDRKGIDRIWLSYFGTASPDYYGIDYNYLPGNFDFNMDVMRKSEPASFLAVSATNLHGVYEGLNWTFLRDKEPVAKIGYSIFVYEFDRPVDINVHRKTPRKPRNNPG